MTQLLDPPARPTAAAAQPPFTVLQRPACRVTVYWYDLGYELRCVRPDGHDGPHRDGVRWFDGYGLQVPRCDEGEQPFVGMRAGSRRDEP